MTKKKAVTCFTCLSIRTSRKQGSSENLTSPEQHGENRSPVATKESPHNECVPLHELGYTEVEVTINKVNDKLGLVVSGGTDNPTEATGTSIYISQIIPGAAADLSGHFQVGYVILSVDRTSLVNVERDVAVKALKESGQTISVVIRRPQRAVSVLPPSPESPSLSGSAPQGWMEHQVTIPRGPSGLGFSLSGGVDGPVTPGDTSFYVTTIIPGGTAERLGIPIVGDRIVEANGVVLANLSHENAVDLLRSSDTVSLLIHRRVLLPVDTQEDAPSKRPVTSRLMEQQGDELGPRGHSAMDHTEHSDPVRATLDPVHPPEGCSTSSNNIFREPRTAVLRKGPNGLGFNIVGGDDNQGIFISFILSGGVADLSGELKKGDQILMVNGIDLRAASHEQAALALKNTGAEATIVVQYRPDEYNLFEQKIAQMREKLLCSNAAGAGLKTSLKKSLCVRALFDYDRTKDSGLPSPGLSFKYGDILHVTNASDDEWWQAVRLGPQGEEEDRGVVPSKRRVERRERARQRTVKFKQALAADPGSSFSSKQKRSFMFARRMPSKSKKDAESEITDVDATTATSEAESMRTEDSVLSYEPVILQELNYARPVVILGTFKERINEDLLNEFPEQFGTCIPHTTRPKKENEVDGRDYHFIPSKEQMEQDIANHLFIEAGQYNENLYGTSVASVRSVAEKKKHCVLDVSGNAIRRLQMHELYPISIFVKPKSVSWLKEMSKRLTDDQAEKAYERLVRLEQEYTEYFTAVVSGETYEDTYSEVKLVIRQQSQPKVWIPSKEKL